MYFQFFYNFNTIFNSKLSIFEILNTDLFPLLYAKISKRFFKSLFIFVFLLSVGYKFLFVKNYSHLFFDLGNKFSSKVSIIFLNILNEPSNPLFETTEKLSKLV